ncbi:MAG: VCBS repeat domain-containing M23 family metallopeptidase [Patescibacteria group bacterium]
MTYKIIAKATIAAAFVGLVFGLSISPVKAAVRDIIFPVVGAVSHSNDFSAPRSGGRIHKGNDIFAERMRPLIAAVDGFVCWIAFPQPSYGYGLEIEDEDGWIYRYLHLNNDTPGTDDGLGAGPTAYAYSIDEGMPVVKGQLLGFVGDSGNAESTPAHLHFEIRTPDDVAVDPFDSLLTASHRSAPVTTPLLPGEVRAYGRLHVGTNIAVGDVLSRYTEDELVTGAGPGERPQVRVYSKSGRLRNKFYAYAENFRGGVDVAVADLTGDGLDEIITAPGPGERKRIKAYTPTGEIVYEFYAYSRDMLSGIRVAAADLNNDGRAEIITAPGEGGPPLIKVFTPSGRLLTKFMAHHSSFRGGVDVTAMVDNELGRAYIVTGAGPGGGPKVRVFNPEGKLRWQFHPYDRSFRGGVRVSAADNIVKTPGPEIYVAPASRGGPDFKVYTKRGKYIDKQDAFEEWWIGGYDIAVGPDRNYVSNTTGDRPASVRLLE